MRSVCADMEDDARELADSVGAAAAVAERLAESSLRIAVVPDRTPRVLLLHESGDVVRELSYDELFSAIALPAEQIESWTARNARLCDISRRAGVRHADHA